MTQHHFAAVVAGLLAGTAPTRADTYTVANLGPLLPAAASGSTGSAINNAGQLAGYYTLGTFADTTVHPFVYAGGAVTEILGENKTPSAINSSGWVSLSGGSFYRPGIGVTDVPVSAGGMNIASAADLNDSGLIVGSQYFSYTSPGGFTYNVTHPYVYNPNTNVTTDLGNTAFGDNGSFFATASGINNSGSVVGQTGSRAAGETYAAGVAFIAKPSGGGYAFTNIGPAVSAAVGATRTNALGVNDSDVVFGTYDDTGFTGQYAFVYANGSAAALGSLADANIGYRITTPNDINNSGVIVGTSTFSIDANYNRVDHAFLYKNGTLSDLNSLVVTGSGFVLNTANAINDAGQITGDGTFQGKRTAFLLNLLGPLYYRGGLGGGLTNAVGATTNFSTDAAGTAINSALPTANNDVIFAASNASNLSTTLAGALAVNSVSFGSGTNATAPVVIGGTGTLTLAAAGTSSVAAGVGIVVRSESAPATINANVALGVSQSWTNNSANTLTVGGGVDLGPATLTVSGSGATTISGPVSGSGGVAVTGAGTVRLSGANTYAGGTTVNNPAANVRVGTAAATAMLGGAGTNVANGQIAFEYSGTTPAATIRGLLAAGFSASTTPGVMDTGVLRSSTATARRGLGYRDDGTAVIVKVALFGDADLDGGVSINDFNALAGNFGQSNRVWTQGDFDYDGGVSINDFNLLAGSFGQSLPSGSPMWAGLLAFAAAHNDLAAFEAVTGVPEPATFGVLAAGMMACRRRRTV